MRCNGKGDPPNNPANPDPTKKVAWGEQSWEEMLVGFFDVAVDPKLAPRTTHIERAAVNNN
ncbi:MAG TPA: hypothetical protein VEV17_00460 [Bryobacteraceae bacterium]|nr:hypothetical protein [Bryobacteraceae bacterium]